MIIELKASIENNVITVEKKYTLTEEHLEALKYIKEKRFYSLRGKNPEFSQELMEDLSDINLIRLDFDAWHLTWHLTDEGKEIASKLK